MAEWSEEMAAKLKRRNEGNAARDQKALDKLKRIQEDGPAAWAAVISDTLAQAHALNREMGTAVIAQRQAPNDELNLEATLDDGTRTVNVRFDVNAGALTWITSKGYEETLHLSVGQDGRMMFHSGMVPMRTGSIARQILETLLA